MTLRIAGFYDGYRMLSIYTKERLIIHILSTLVEVMYKDDFTDLVLQSCGYGDGINQRVSSPEDHIQLMACHLVEVVPIDPTSSPSSSLCPAFSQSRRLIFSGL
jgi:hypothetical protein